MRALLVTLFFVASTGASWSSEIAKKAEALEKTREGRDYSPGFVKMLSGEVGPVMQDCSGLTVTGDLTGLDLLLLVDSAGRVSDARVKPASAAGKCVRDGIAKLSFPPPPAPPRWMHVKLKVNVSVHGD